MRTEELAKISKALGADVRIRILELLKGHALCVGALSARLDVTQGAVSQHLRILREAGLVTAEKRGTYVHYELNRKALSEFEAAVAALSTTPKQKGAMRCVMKRRRAARSRKS